MLSVPQSVNATDSGSSPLSFSNRSNNFSTTRFAHSTAAVVGIDWGSRACMFLPVGSTPGLRMGSPPGPGSMYWPSSASTSAPELVVRDDLAQAELEVLEERLEHLVLRRLREARRREGLAVGRLAEHAAESFFHHIWTSLTRPWLSVDSSTSARTAARVPCVIFWSNSTSCNTPSLALR